MSAGIAHEINNPLAVISYACQLLEAGEESAEEQLELLHRVGNEVDRLKILTTELLSYSGNQDYNKKLTDLNMTLQESGSLLRYELNKEQVTLTEDLGELPVVNVDNNKFKQIFINLILNAVQAMGKGGCLHISSGTLPGNTLFVRFSDNGPGISDDLKNKIFEPFFTSREDGSGTGLGLYLCRKIIADYQGELTVSDSASGGCCFELKLPIDSVNNGT